MTSDKPPNLAVPAYLPFYRTQTINRRFLRGSFTCGDRNLFVRPGKFVRDFMEKPFHQPISYALFFPPQPATAAYTLYTLLLGRLPYK